MLALIAAIALAQRGGSDPGTYGVEDILAAGLRRVQHLEPHLLREKLLPRLKRRYPHARWVMSKRTLDGKGVFAEFCLKADDDSGYKGRTTAVFWPSPDGLKVQTLALPDVDSILGEGGEFFIRGETYVGSRQMVWCGDATSGGNWSWPLIQLYALKSGRWIKQTRDTDFSDEDLSALPGSKFVRRHGKVDPTMVETSTMVYPAHLSQPHVGPLLLYRTRWKILDGKCEKGVPRELPTPLAALDKLAGYAQAGDGAAFNSRVNPSSRKRLWLMLKQSISVHCPRSLQHPNCPDLDAYDIVDGMVEAGHTTIHLRKRHGRWCVVRLDHHKADVN